MDPIKIGMFTSYLGVVAGIKITMMIIPPYGGLPSLGELMLFSFLGCLAGPGLIAYLSGLFGVSKLLDSYKTSSLYSLAFPVLCFLISAAASTFLNIVLR